MITPRLKMIIDNVVTDSIADIGTDHAYVPIELVRSGRCRRAAATDIRKGPAQTARNHINRYGLDIDVRVGAGLSVIGAGEFGEIIIAGMGGKMICSILEADEEKAKSSRLILQPMNAQYEMRKFLVSHGYNIISEDLALEGFKVYNLIVCGGGPAARYESEIDYHLPAFLRNCKYFKDLYAKKMREFTRISRGNDMSEKNGNDSLAEYYKKMAETAEMKYKINVEKPVLYAVTDGKTRGKELEAAVEAALKGGASAVQLRDKSLSAEELAKEAALLKPVCRRYGALLIVNDSVQAAKISGADGVHLGQGDGSPEEARKILGADKIIGVTARTPEQAKAAEKAGADYLGSGAVLGTSTRADAVKMSFNTLRMICESVDIPVFAIGGINAENAALLSGIPISGAAVVSGIFGQADIEAAARSIKGTLDNMLR